MEYNELYNTKTGEINARIPQLHSSERAREIKKN